VRTIRLFADDRLVAPRARRAVGPFERARGLLARPALGSGEALLLAPCSGIHTCGMRYPIDAAFLDRDGRVLRVASNLIPWRFARCAGSHAVVEWPAGDAERFQISTGTILKWQDT
jgi:uncharacterized membrane protein (UPF0127 family)